MAKIKQDLGQLFENNSNCYADTTDDSVVMAMDKEQFVKIVTDLLTESVSAESSHDAPAALPLQSVMPRTFSKQSLKDAYIQGYRKRAIMSGLKYDSISELNAKTEFENWYVNSYWA